MKYCKEMARQRKADLSTIETELKNCEDACVTDPSVSNMEILGLSRKYQKSQDRQEISDFILLHLNVSFSELLSKINN